MTPQPTNADQCYLDRNWDVVGAMAWQGFLKHGRGTVVVQHAVQPKEQMLFLPLKLLAGNPLCQAFADLARDYDPRREVVVVFVRPLFAITVYKGSLSGRETPPEAHERLLRRLFGKETSHARTALSF